ncbi:hypothetical protein [Lamprobacter modestohalophilus]|uniref:hypothetical protein n=1 Tax=Lamprobacter modestohalophilus TaxID=1064514 RepID=UPI001904D237|nr:hypothetical protein [Lamprobacter modestohalophilus]
MAKHHDTGYKELFSHPEFFQQLIEGFAPAEIAALMDFSTGYTSRSSVLNDDPKFQIAWVYRSRCSWQTSLIDINSPREAIPIVFLAVIYKNKNTLTSRNRKLCLVELAEPEDLIIKISCATKRDPKIAAIRGGLFEQRHTAAVMDGVDKNALNFSHDPCCARPSWWASECY